MDTKPWTESQKADKRHRLLVKQLSGSKAIGQRLGYILVYPDAYGLSVTKVNWKQ